MPEYTAPRREEIEKLLAAGHAFSPEEWRALVRTGILDSPPVSGAPYAAWRALREEPVSRLLDERLARSEIDCHALPLISVLMPVCDPPADFLDAAVRSVREQSTPHWELCIADDASENPAIRALLVRHAREDARIRIIHRRTRGHISAATGSAPPARGMYCAFMDHDDLLHRHALLHMALAARERPDVALLFSDEDRLDAQGNRTSPHFKPGFNPDLLLACNCVCHLSACRTDRLHALGGLRIGFEGAQDHDLALRVLETAGPRAFLHVPHVLYHWRMHTGSTSAGLAAKPYAAAAALRAKTEHLDRRAVPANVENLPESAFSSLRFTLPRPAPLLSFILTLPENAPEAVAWVRKLTERTKYPKHEILLAFVKNPAGQHISSADRTRAAEKLSSLPPAPDPTAARNAAAHAARGGVLLFVDAFTLPLEPNWAGELVAAALWEEIGAAGNRRLTPNGFLAHAGLALGETELFPAFAGLHPNSPGYFSQASLVRNVAALPASCFCIRKSVFLELDGFDDKTGPLAVADFCLRLHERGLRRLCTPLADMVGAEEPLLPYTPAFSARWNSLFAAPPFQNPCVLPTFGGWKPRFKAS